jgi:CheY-like chemotaxis protein
MDGGYADQTQSAVILLVEDDPGDQKLVKYALQFQKYQSNLKIVGTAEEALDYLRRSVDGDESAPRPDIILLDLNMPGMGGKRFLRNIKADEQLCAIPVVVVSTSGAEQDVTESYKLHAAGYVQKSSSLDKLRRIIQKLTQYWFATSTLIRK